MKWASGGGEEVLISRAAVPEREESGEVEGCEGERRRRGVAPIGKMPEAMVGGHRLEILHTLKTRFPKTRARI